MADQDFNIKVVTTADTSGIKQTSAELDALSSKARLGVGPDAATLAARQAALRSAFAPVPSELGGAADATKKVAEEMKKVEPSALFAGVNIARARQEATFLARELATGIPTTRTLSSLLGAMGPYIAGAVGAGFALNRAIVANAERQLKVNQELDVQLTKVTELAAKWSELGRSVTGPEDMLKLTSAIIPTLDAAQKKFIEFQNTSAVADSWKKLVDVLTAGIPQVGKVFEESFNKQAAVLSANVQRLREAAIASARVGEETEAAFDAKKLEPFEQAITELNADIEKHKAIQQEAGTKNIEKYNEEATTVRNLESQLRQLYALEKERASVRDQVSLNLDEPLSAADRLQKKIANVNSELKTLGVTAKDPVAIFAQGERMLGEQGKRVRELAAELAKLEGQAKSAGDKATSEADASVQRVIANEKAAQQAKAQGDDKSAEMFQKSADAYERGLRPAQQQQLENIRKLQQETGQLTEAQKAAKPIEGGRKAEVGESQEFVNQIERNRIAAEKQAAAVDAVQEQPIAKPPKTPGDFESQEANRQEQEAQRTKDAQAGKIERQTQAARSDPELKTISTKLDQLLQLWR